MAVKACPRGTRKVGEKCKFTREIAVNKSLKTGKMYYEATNNSYIDNKGKEHLPIEFDAGELDTIRYTKTTTPIVAIGIIRARRK